MAPRSDTDEALNPRTRRVRQVILDAAAELLVTCGAADVTPSRVAAHAEVARTTIYRHWPDQSSLLLATIDMLTAPHQAATRHGDLGTDVRADLEGLRTRLVIRNVGTVFAALAAHAAHDEAFAVAQRRFMTQLTEPLRTTLALAQDRGDLEATVDCEIEVTLLTGPILHEQLVMQRDVTDELLDELVTRWLGRHSAG